MPVENVTTMRINDTIFPKIVQHAPLKAGVSVQIFTAHGILTYKCAHIYVEHMYTSPVNHPACIFEYLGIYDKSVVATDAYGYQDDGGNWPEFRNRDYAAAMRLLNKFAEHKNILQIIIG